jgi:hypothetical protein
VQSCIGARPLWESLHSHLCEEVRSAATHFCTASGGNYVHLLGKLYRYTFVRRCAVQSPICAQPQCTVSSHTFFICEFA